MTTILTFDQSRCRKANAESSPSKVASASADILMFTGVRRERLPSKMTLLSPPLHEPMFDDNAPDKPSGKKRRRGKNG